MTTHLIKILAGQPAFRTKQIEKAWFDVNLNSYDEITTLPIEMRKKLANLPWLSLELNTDLKSKLDNTRKLLFKLHDGQFIETVLMGRASLRGARNERRGNLAVNNGIASSSLRKLETPRNDSDVRYTICVSSQVGCPMKCAFCATGKAGFKRNLSAEEIVDQYRFCQRLLGKENARVANIVMMGQGEPLLNYDNVKLAVKIILANSDLGPTKITISTAGVPAVMEKLLTDDDFPAVRWALSLHSAIEETRKKIMPSNKAGFLDWLVKWAGDYHKKLGTKTHFIGLEYIMLSGVNDDEKHLKALIKLGRRMPYVRINLIPYNTTDDSSSVAETNAREEKAVSNYRVYTRTPHEQIEHWHEELMKAGFTSTIRYSQGQDIFAACGQLRNAVK